MVLVYKKTAKIPQNILNNTEENYCADIALGTNFYSHFKTDFEHEEYFKPCNFSSSVDKECQSVEIMAYWAIFDYPWPRRWGNKMLWKK